MADEVISPDKQLRMVKLDAYFELLSEKAKYRRLNVYRKTFYPHVNWVNALVAFFDVMFSEAQETEYKEKYKEIFEVIKGLDHNADITYESLLSCTEEMMRFAHETGMTKLPKHAEGTTPGGADYA